jgi:hypothetical protein
VGGEGAGGRQADVAQAQDADLAKFHAVCPRGRDYATSGKFGRFSSIRRTPRL